MIYVPCGCGSTAGCRLCLPPFPSIGTYEDPAFRLQYIDRDELARLRAQLASAELVVTAALAFLLTHDASDTFSYGEVEDDLRDELSRHQREYGGG